MRLIDADALITEICEGCSTPKGLCAAGDRICASVDWIEDAPTIEAEPVKHGRWVSLTECANAGVYCSVCNKKVYKEDYAWRNRKNKLRSCYCPYCGAKMDLEG